MPRKAEVCRTQIQAEQEVTSEQAGTFVLEKFLQGGLSGWAVSWAEWEFGSYSHLSSYPGFVTPSQRDRGQGSLPLWVFLHLVEWEKGPNIQFTGM